MTAPAPTAPPPATPRVPVADARRTWQALRDHVRPLRGRLAVATLLLVAATALTLAGPAVLGRVVDAATAGRGGELLPLTVLFALVMAAGAGLTWVGVVRVATVGEDLLRDLRQAVFDRTTGLPLHTVEEVPTGDLLSRATNDISTLTTASRYVVPTATVAVLELVLTLGALFLVSPVLAATTLVLVPFVMVGGRWYLRRAPALYRDLRAHTGDTVDTLHEAHDGIRTLLALHATSRVRARLQRQVDHVYAAEMRATTLRNVLRPTVSTGQALALGLALLVGTLGVQRGTLTIGIVTAAALYLLRLVEPILVLLELLDELQATGAALARVVGLVELAPRQPVVVSPARPRDGTVRIRSLRFGYGDGDVLHGIDLALAPGERLAVVGPSGAGKTTLAKLLAGVHRADDGAIELGGVPLERITDLRWHVQLVTQEQHVFAGPLGDDLRLAAPDADDGRLLAVLGEVGAELWVTALADGLATRVGDGGRRLTPTQAQQVALARLLLADPPVVVLDEATAALDPAAARSLEGAVRRVLAGRTVLTVTHRLGAATTADRIALLRDGRITECGTHEELLAAGGGYADLYRAWSTGV